jgi:hypothetical protein
MGVAARDLALTVFHFGCVLKTIAPVAKGCPPVSQYIDPGAFKAATRLFAKSFPELTVLRDAVAHSGEFSSSSDYRSRHSASIFENGMKITISNQLSGRTLQFTAKGKNVGIEASYNTLSILDECINHIAQVMAPTTKLVTQDWLSWKTSQFPPSVDNIPVI